MKARKALALKQTRSSTFQTQALKIISYKIILGARLVSTLIDGATMKI
jgi:hypothetical protein